MKYLRLFPLLALVILSHGANSQELNRIWSSEAVFNVPESVLYHKFSNRIFVSNIQGGPADKDGEGFISLVKVDGSVEELQWVSGISAPKGMAADAKYLYVSDINELVIIDIELKQIHNRIKYESAKFLNDVCMTETGDVFVSDAATGQILKLEDDKLVLWLEGDYLKGVNGLFYEDYHLLVGTANNMLKVSLPEKTHEIYVPETVAIDGIEADNEGGYYFSSWQGMLFHVVPDEKPIVLLNTVEQKINCADIGFIHESKLILVPTFFDNRIIAYRME